MFTYILYDNILRLIETIHFLIVFKYKLQVPKQDFNCAFNALNMNYEYTVKHGLSYQIQMLH